VFKNNESIYNPLISRCSYRYCRKIYYLKVSIFFSLFPKTPIIAILIVLKTWLLDEKNELEINNILKNKFTDFSINLVHINDMLYNDKFIIVHYMKDKYILEEISELGKNECLAVDESNVMDLKAQAIRNPYGVI